MGYVTSEKIQPSPIVICGDIGSAVASERQSMRNGDKAPLKDILTKLVAEYNRMTTSKKHRIDSSRRSLIYNLFLGSFFYFQIQMLFFLF